MSNIYDDSAFDEALLKNLLRSPEVFTKARALNITGDDFLTSTLAGIQLYKHIALIALASGPAPIDRRILEVNIRQRYNDGLLVGTDAEDIQTLVHWFYTSDLSPEYFLEHLKPFIIHRRFSKASVLNRTDPVAAFNEMHRISSTLSQSSNVSQSTSSNPFSNPIFKDITSGIYTGFQEVDVKMHGLGKEECGLLIGHSGSGKTAISSNFIKNAAYGGRKALYISLEEPEINIINRWYANFFEINYTDLHYGNPDARMLLETGFADMKPSERLTLMTNLNIIDARELAPITADGIKQLIENKAQGGFIPEVVLIDQMDYMTPMKALNKGAQKWEEQQQIAFECDKLSEHKILGEHTFGLWVVHQAKGEMRWEFGYDDISGCKGIVKPFDTAIGIGRYSRETPFVNLFSMKVRHTEQFRQSYRAYFEHMKFMKANWSPKDVAAASAGNNALKTKKTPK